MVKSRQPRLAGGEIRFPHCQCDVGGPQLEVGPCSHFTIGVPTIGVPTSPGSPSYQPTYVFLGPHFVTFCNCMFAFFFWAGEPQISSQDRKVHSFDLVQINSRRSTSEGLYRNWPRIHLHIDTHTYTHTQYIYIYIHRYVYT